MTSRSAINRALITCISIGFTAATLRAAESSLETRTYSLQPNSLRERIDVPTVTNQVPGYGLSIQYNLQQFFEHLGVPFSEGASVTFDNQYGVLTVRNNVENLKLFERALGRLNILATQVTIEARYLQMSRETAEDLFKPEDDLAKVSVVHAEVLKRIRELVRRKEITVIAQPKVTTVSGNTAQVKSVEEFRYPTEFTPVTTASTNSSTQATTGTAILVPGGFETRELGTLLNVTPTLGPDGQTINLTLVPEISAKGEPANRIETTTPDGKVAVEQPRFRSRQVTTTVQMLSGTTMLLGVADPIEGEDRDQIVLILLTATVVYLQ